MRYELGPSSERQPRLTHLINALELFYLLKSSIFQGETLTAAGGLGDLENTKKTPSRCLTWYICLTYKVIAWDNGSNIQRRVLKRIEESDQYLPVSSSVFLR